MFTSIRSARLLSLAAGVLAVSAAHAVDDDGFFGLGLSVGPQVLVGTAGIEPGLAAEYRFGGDSDWSVRPEIFISEDGKVGGGGSLLWRTPETMHMPRWSSLAVGPRVVYHNADEAGTELGGAVIWTIDLGIDRPMRNTLEVIGTLGAVEDPEDDGTKFGAAIGAAYAFRF